MHTHNLEFRIDQLRKDKMILILESIAIFIFALFVTVFLPQLLFQFLFANKELTAEPPVIKFIPVVSFAIAMIYFVYATVLLMMKKMKIMQLEKEMSMMMVDDGGCECGGDCGCGGHSHEDWMSDDDSSSDNDEMAAVMAQSKKKVTAKKKATKKA